MAPAPIIRPSSRNNHACTPVAAASATPASTPAIMIAFAMPSAHHASAADCNHRDDRRTRRVTGSRVDDVVVRAASAPPRSNPTGARDERRRRQGDARRRPSSHRADARRGRAIHRRRQLASSPHVAAETHERAPRATIDEPARHEIRGKPLAEPAEIDADAGRDANAGHVVVDLDEVETGARPRTLRRLATDRHREQPPRTCGRNRRVRGRRERSDRTSRPSAIEVRRARECQQHRVAHLDPFAGARVQ